MLDWMALHKLNTFHWHLTDDQGWRLEIKKYPRLTERRRVARARGRRTGRRHRSDRPASRVSTAATTRRTKCATSCGTRPTRFITVVPEIEMPGHAQAAIAAYPRSAPKAPRRPCHRIGACTRICSTSTRRRSRFLEDVLTEVMALFPGHVHPRRRRRGGEGSVARLAARAAAHARAGCGERGGAAGLLHASHGEVPERASAASSSAGTRFSKAGCPLRRP